MAWRFNNKIRTITAGKILRIEIQASANIHWSADHWQTAQDTSTRNPGVNIQVADLPTQELPSGAEIEFTFYWLEAKQWEGQNFVVQVVSEKAYKSGPTDNNVRSPASVARDLKQGKKRR